MSTPQKKLITENLISTLGAITTAGGYNYTVGAANVARTLRDLSEEVPDSSPRLSVVPDLETPHTYEHHPTQMLRVTQPYIIAGVLSASTAALRLDYLDKLEDDIIAALSVDTTRGGYATMTTFVDCAHTDADEDEMDSRGGVGSLVMRIRVVYHRDLSLTT